MIYSVARFEHENPSVYLLVLAPLVMVAGSCRLAIAAPEGVEKPAAVAKAVANQAGQDESQHLRRQGEWIHVPLPIDNSVVLRVRQSIQRALGTARDERPVVFVLEFAAPEGSADVGQGTQFDDAHKLASFLVSDQLNGAGTVAYVPKELKGHAVLVAMACEKIIMAPTAKMGDAGADEKTIGKTLLAAYDEIAAIVASPCHPRSPWVCSTSLAQVFKLKTELSDVRFADPGQLAEIARQHRILAKDTIKRPGEAMMMTGREGRDWGIVKFLADDRRDVIRELEFSSHIDEGDPSGGKPWQPIRIELRGPIRPGLVDSVERLMEAERRKGANFICVWIDSPGGDPLESKRLADYLIGLPSEEVRTVAFIPNEARADAALVAMACDQIVMQPRAVLGGPGQYQMKRDEINSNRLVIRDTLAPRKARSWSLWAAMFDPHLDVYRCRRLGAVEYFSEEELQGRQPKLEQGEPGPLWEKGDRVTTPGEVLALTGEKAQEYGLATWVVDNFAQFKQHYGLENDPALVEPGWIDHLARFLGQPGMVGLLIFLGGLGIYVELHSPGMGIGAFIAIVAFAIFFWSRFLEGTADWLAVTLFVTGCICLLTEIFILPGFVIFGLGGGILVLASIVLASQTFLIPQNEYQMARLQTTLFTLTAAVGGLIGAIWVLNHWLPSAPCCSTSFSCRRKARRPRSLAAARCSSTWTTSWGQRA